MVKIPKFDQLTGRSTKMELVFQRIQEAASSEVTVLIVGESGTGKELVAQSIHQRSERSGGPFIPVNTGAISANLVGSELFGHQKGAFTGATETKPGKFEQAHRGTIFLDEISSMDDTTQISLLRVLENHKIQRIGGQRFHKIDVRVIAASNEDLFSASVGIDSTGYGGIIRNDLFHRLSVFTITLPPLRERQEDITILANELLGQACRKFDKKIEGFEQPVLDALTRYPWPGNVRELKNIIQRAVLICHGPLVNLDCLPGRIYRERTEMAEISIPLGSTLFEAEREMIIRSLEHNRGNRKKTAEGLGISRRALYNKLKAHGLS